MTLREYIVNNTSLKIVEEKGDILVVEAPKGFSIEMIEFLDGKPVTDADSEKDVVVIKGTDYSMYASGRKNKTLKIVKTNKLPKTVLIRVKQVLGE